MATTFQTQNYKPVAGLIPAYVTQTATAISTTSPTQITGKCAVLALNNSTPVRLISICGVYLSTATVGTRQLMIGAVDQNNNLVFAAGGAAAEGPAASGTSIITVGAGHVATATNSQGMNFTMPNDMILPPSASIIIGDRAAIDAADTTTFAVTYGF